MSAVVELHGVKLRVAFGEWTIEHAPDERLAADLLRSVRVIGTREQLGSGYFPNVDAALAEFVASKLVGRVVQADAVNDQLAGDGVTY